MNNSVGIPTLQIFDPFISENYAFVCYPLYASMTYDYI